MLQITYGCHQTLLHVCCLNVRVNPTIKQHRCGMTVLSTSTSPKSRGLANDVDNRLASLLTTSAVSSTKRSGWSGQPRQRFCSRLIRGITRRSITAKVKRQGTNPLPTTSQITRSWSNSQITNSDNQNRATLVANEIPAKRHSEELRWNHERN